MQQFANTERDFSQRVSAVHPISIDICWTLAVGALIAMTVAFGLGQIWQKFIGLGPSPASLIRYVPEVAHAFYPGELPDVRVQKRAYQIGLLAIFLPFLICAFGNDRIRGALFRRLTPFSLHVRRLKRSPVLFWCAMALVYLIEVRRQGDTLISPLGLRSLLFAAALLLAIGLFIREFRKAAWYSSGIRMLAIASGAAILVAAVAGLLFPAEMRQWPYVSLTMVEAHFGFVTGAADRLGAGLRLFDDVRPYYGLFPEALVGAAIRLAGPFDWAAIYRCVQVCQLAMLLCICLALFFWRGTRRPFLWLVLPSALVLPDLFAAYHMNWFPNQTGWRFLGFGFALVTLCVAPRLSKLATLLLFAATASVALVWNPETGLVVVFGFIAYLATGYARPSFLGGMRKVGEL
ncbi:hypothetical protein, partial [Bradyrhizobium sp. STM 3843]|uniref:hypothetical protein n=1 Tax=Bradyrhizobium sp. STM 3843 TaxID=551947 RepID=UPI001111D614